jgi:hypothetical protein
MTWYEDCSPLGCDAVYFKDVSEESAASVLKES